MTVSRYLLGALLVGALGLGVGFGRVSRSAPEPIVPASSDARVLRELEKLDARVRHLSTLTSSPGVLAERPASVAEPAVATATPAPEPLEPEREAPTPEQIEAGDRLVALTDRIIASGRITPDDRRALRETANETDDERRDETLLALVREVNKQRVRPTEPGPLF